MLEFRGPSATTGYFRNAAKTARAVPRRLARDRRPRLHRGRRPLHHRPRQGHHHPRRPHIASARDRGSGRAIPGIRKGGVAAFGVADPATGTERLVVLAETNETDPDARADAESRARTRW